MAVDTSAGGAERRPPPRVWLIAGPTASGKSVLALALAERVGGEIVNADALQLYRDLPVLTARPPPPDEARAPHHLYGLADAGDAWSAGRWLRAAAPVIAEVRARGRTPIVVGGTGLYFTALTRGLAQIPSVPDAVRDGATARFDRVGEAVFRAGLHDVDPESATRIAPGDRQRLVRAAAVHAATGRSLSDWRARTSPPLAPDAWRGVVLEPERGELYARCDARIDAMIVAGAVEEAARLDARSLPPGLPALKAVGYREFAAAARGEVTLAQARDTAARETRRYAKRQATWFRNQTPDWPRIATLDAERQAARLFTLVLGGGSVTVGKGDGR